MTWLIVRPAAPADAEALVELGAQCRAEGELWLTYDRSRGATSARYLQGRPA